MRGVRCSPTGEISISTESAPEGPGVRVQVRSAGICGSDLSYIRAGAIPVILGHEFAGVTEDGIAVAVQPNWPCGTCSACAAGSSQRCELSMKRLHGLVGLDGGFADEVLVDASLLRHLPSGLLPEDAALAEPAAVALHVLARAGVSAGDRVLVVGAGSIGLMAAAAAADRGVDVQVLARHPHQAEAAQALGLQPVETADGDAFDRVVDAAGSATAMHTAIGAAAGGATIASIGSSGWSPALDERALFKELSFVASIFYTKQEFVQALELLARHPEIVDTVITHRFPLAEAARAVEVASARGDDRAIKVLIQP